jgi:hypothetical protein
MGCTGFLSLLLTQNLGSLKGILLLGADAKPLLTA